MWSRTRSISALVVVLALFSLIAGCTGGGSAVTSAPVAPVTATPALPAPTPTVAPTPTASPAATAVPMTDGQGPEHFVGRVTQGPILAVPYTEKKVGDVDHLTGGVVTFDINTNDVRMAGPVTWTVSADMYSGTVGPLWGAFEVKNAKGTWTGPCSAGGWGSIGQLVAGCWLTGTGAYKGSTAYLALVAMKPDAMATVEGIIFQGAAPKS